MQLSPFMCAQHRMSAHSESQQQLREGAFCLPTKVPYGLGDTAILLHPRVLELRGEFNEAIITSSSPFLPLMHTWTYQTSEGPSEGPPQVNNK